MKKAIIYGAGGTGRRIYKTICDTVDVVAFADGDITKNNNDIFGIICLPIEEAIKLKYDVVIIGATSGYFEMHERLNSLGVPDAKIDNSFCQSRVYARIAFLERMEKILVERYGNADFAVAEAGVFRGEFAKEINRVFSKSKLYLFDTFEGFDEADLSREKGESDVFKLMTDMRGHFSYTSVDYVLSRMKNKTNCIVKKGFFPDTALGVDDNFGFVSLDMDLYEPMIAGMRFFYPRMIPGGCILVDDYFSPGHPNVRKAVRDYENEIQSVLIKIPIGDNNGLAIYKDK